MSKTYAVLILLSVHLYAFQGSPVNKQWAEKGLNSVKGALEDVLVKNMSCHLRGRSYLHGDHIIHENPCDTCMCFRGDVLCWSVECPPTAKSLECREVKFPGRCCPVYECPTTAGFKTTPGPSGKMTYSSNLPKSNKGCHLAGRYYPPGEVIPSATGPCLECRCGGEGSVVCSPRECSRQPQKQTDAAVTGELPSEKPIVNIHQARQNEVNGRMRRQFL